MSRNLVPKKNTITNLSEANNRMQSLILKVESYVERLLTNKTLTDSNKQFIENRIKFYEQLIAEQQSAVTNVVVKIGSARAVTEVVTAVEKYKDTSLQNSLKLISYITAATGLGALAIRNTIIKFLNTVLRQINYDEYNANACAEYNPTTRKWYGGKKNGSCKLTVGQRDKFAARWFKKSTNAVFGGVNNVLGRITNAGEAGVDVAYACLLLSIMIVGALTAYWLILSRFGSEMSFGYGAFKIGTKKANALPTELTQGLLKNVNRPQPKSTLRITNVSNEAGPSRPRKSPSKASAAKRNEAGPSRPRKSPSKASAAKRNEAGPSPPRKSPPKAPSRPRKSPSKASAAKRNEAGPSVPGMASVLESIRSGKQVLKPVTRRTPPPPGAKNKVKNGKNSLKSVQARNPRQRAKTPSPETSQLNSLMERMQLMRPSKSNNSGSNSGSNSNSNSNN